MVLAGATVVNDVVFTGGLDGIFRALSTETGEQLWSDQLASGLNAPPAISGDMFLIPAGAMLFQVDELGTVPVDQPRNELVAYRIPSTI